MASKQVAVLISRGAEAEIYLSELAGVKVVVKKRVAKPYRTPEFNRLFITTRTKIEAKILSELYDAGLSVPAPIIVDEEHGVIVLEYVEGERLSDIIDSLSSEEVVKAAEYLGDFAAKMHSLGIYHGDFTLANVILSKKGLVVIDFGLAGYSDDIEEYAIDLHLMLRSVHAMRPSVVDAFSKHMTDSYMRNYKGNGVEVLKRVAEIRTRGRYIDKELRKSIMRERYVD